MNAHLNSERQECKTAPLKVGHREWRREKKVNMVDVFYILV
jgi:hypothetical protein